MSSCTCKRTGFRFLFNELNQKNKKFVHLNRCTDAKLLADALAFAKTACGSLHGKKTSTICTSIEEFNSWRSDKSFIPCYDTGRILAYLDCGVIDCIDQDCVICYDGVNIYYA